MDRSKPVVIVNPRSGAGLSDKRWAGLVGVLTDGLGPFDTRFTERSGHAREIAREEAAAGRALVVACGGDGTISEVTDGVLSSGVGGVEVGIIPRGTGGDLRRTLDLPQDLGAAARHVRVSPARPVDAGRVTFVSHDGGTATQHFVNVASFGFSSAVALKANTSSKRLGAKASFLGITIRSLFTYDNAEILVSVDGGEKQRHTVLLGAVGNARSFGGGMKICPDALLDDGAFDLVIVGDLGRLDVLRKLGRIYAGTHLTIPQVSTARARVVRVEPADPAAVIPLELDGETPGRLPATFEILPGALRLRF